MVRKGNDPRMSSNAIFVYDPRTAAYKFNDQHPFDPIRHKLTIDLLREAGALSDREMRRPAIEVGDELLSLVHREDYLKAVKTLSDPNAGGDMYRLAEQYGFHTEDTPSFGGMHEAACAIVAGSLDAADAVMSGQAQHAFHLAGGLHHAFPHKAAGFCIYNDAAVAIQHIRNKYGARVLYVDTDVHHGDGVQWVFYDTPEVCTYSIHETGKYLFPGTGYAYERGLDAGYGACFNVPLEPYTEDESWLESFNATLRKVVSHFQPDVIVSQHGCDAHAFDPLSHIHCSMRIYAEIPAIIHELAHRHAGGKWIAIGGGGYDLWRVVPRAWSLIWLEMSDHPLAEAVRNGSAPALPDEWIRRWQPESPVELPSRWLDDPAAIPPIPRREQIERQNRHTQSIVIQEL